MKLVKSFFGGSQMISIPSSEISLTNLPVELFGARGIRYLDTFAPFRLYMPNTQEVVMVYAVVPPIK